MILPPNHPFLTRATLELAYFSRYFKRSQQRRGGAGAILRFERVRPRRSSPFQPLISHEITPDFLDSVIHAIKGWKLDIVSIDEVCRRAAAPPSPRRFVSLTFDGGYKDLIVHAYPVLAKHGVPFTVYVPSAFPDGVGEAWWLALEAIVALKSRLSLMKDRQELHFDIAEPDRKYQAYAFLVDWMRSLSPADLSLAIRDLCRRYSIDFAAISREASMDWSDLAKLADDPLVTIGSATVNYPILANLDDAATLREMTMGAAVGKSAFRRDIRHFAYPFGDRTSWRQQQAAIAAEAGFVSAVSAVSGVVGNAGRTNLHALPRIAWDGRQRSLRVMHGLLSGLTLPRGRN